MMQFNSPIPGAIFHWGPNLISQKMFIESMPPTVVGAGDIVSTTAPDGSVFFYFLPGPRPPHVPVRYPSNINDYCYWPAAQELWLIRSICNLNPMSFYNSQVPISQEIKPITHNTNEFKPFNESYYQKFHNDAATSTSDLHYFYPSLRKKEPLNICAAVQVDAPMCGCCECQETSNGSSNQRRSHRRESSENMSVDEQDVSHRKHKKRRGTEQEMGNKSDKHVVTYADQSSNCINTDARETQTPQKYTRKDVQTETKKPKTRRTRATKHRCCPPSDCCCLSSTSYCD